MSETAAAQLRRRPARRCLRLPRRSSRASGLQRRARPLHPHTLRVRHPRLGRNGEPGYLRRRSPASGLGETAGELLPSSSVRQVPSLRFGWRTPALLRMILDKTIWDSDLRDIFAIRPCSRGVVNAVRITRNRAAHPAEPFSVYEGLRALVDMLTMVEAARMICGRDQQPRSRQS